MFPAGGGSRGWTHASIMFIQVTDAIYPPPSLWDTSASGGQVQTGEGAEGMGVGAEMGVYSILLKVVCRLFYFRAIQSIKTAKVALKGTADFLEIIYQGRLFFF